MAGLEDIDELQPLNTVVVPDLPSRQRELREKVIDTIELEHHLAGEHKINRGTTAARGSATKDDQIYYNTDEGDIQYTAASAWNNLGFFTKRIKQGQYTGDGSPVQSIIGVGFQPDMVFIFPLDHTKDCYIKTAQHVTVTSTNITDGVTSVEGIQSLDADGFSVGNEPNDNTKKYGYIALKDL